MKNPRDIAANLQFWANARRVVFCANVSTGLVYGKCALHSEFAILLELMRHTPLYCIYWTGFKINHTIIDLTTVRCKGWTKHLRMSVIRFSLSAYKPFAPIRHHRRWWTSRLRTFISNIGNRLPGMTRLNRLPTWCQTFSLVFRQIGYGPFQDRRHRGAFGGSAFQVDPRKICFKYIMKTKILAAKMNFSPTNPKTWLRAWPFLLLVSMAQRKRPLTMLFFSV